MEPRKHPRLEGKFFDVGKAASYVGLGLLTHYPDAVVEVELWVETPATHRRVEGDVKNVLPFLAQFCRKFPMAHVQYDRDDPQGHIASIACYCDHTSHKACPHRCTGRGDRPRVTVSVKKSGNVECAASPKDAREVTPPGES
jgi:hypothetical protein